MKHRFLALLILSVLSVGAISGCSTAQSVTLSPSGENDTSAIQDAISSLKKGGVLNLAQGTYYVSETININKKDNVTIKGDNAIIVRKDIDASTVTIKDCVIINLYKSSKVKMSGITFKYDGLTSLSGTVAECDAGNGKVYIKPYDDFKPTGKEVYCAFNTFDNEGNPDTKLEKYKDDGFAQTVMDNGNVCISGLSYEEVSRLTEGTPVGLRASLLSDGVIKILDSSDVVFEDITVRNSFSGVFFSGGRTFNLTLRRVDISPESDKAYFSSNADGLHIAAIGGKLTVEDCTFIKLGDDCVNVHGMAYSVTQLDGNTLTAFMKRYNTNMLADWAAKGDEIEFYDQATFKLLGSAKIKKLNALTGKITFDQLPDGVTDGAVMANKTLHPSVVISDCTVKSNRARAFLLQTENAVVKNCDISGTRLAAILISPDIDYWYEMSPGRNITITGNTITNCGKAAGAAIVTHTSHEMKSNYPADVNKNITVEGNTFNNCPSAVNATSVNGLKFNNNTLNGLGDTGVFYAVNTIRCENVEIGENTLNDCSIGLVRD
ncbi:MAG: hypothetical protein IJF58_02115 [Clostridia bacterium]|nr:hypothetical protein [Clostridia bacterium]